MHIEVCKYVKHVWVALDMENHRAMLADMGSASEVVRYIFEFGSGTINYNCCWTLVMVEREEWDHRR